MIRAHTSPAPFQELFHRFEQAGKELFLVGGCVRDTLLGHSPKDYDFATDARPRETKDILRQAGLNAIPVGEAFGTIATILDGEQYEITTYRVRESYTRGSRHPSVVFGDSIETDLSRRDLTINAMAMAADGAIIDPFGGRRDLDKGVLRVPKGGIAQTREIFQDDPLRILRVARFAARLAFQPDPTTTEGARSQAHTVLSVSRERWKSELDRLLEADSADSGLRWLAEVGALFFCVPELWSIARDDAGGRWSQTLRLLSRLPPRAVIRWAGLLSAVAYREVGSAPDRWWDECAAMVADSVSRRFRFSTRERRLLGYLVAEQGVASRFERVPQRVKIRQLAIDASNRTGCANPRPVLDELVVFSVALHEERNLEHLGRAVFEEKFDELEVFGIEPRLPKGLGALIREETGVAGTELGAVMTWLREQLVQEILPWAESAPFYARAARQGLGLS